MTASQKTKETWLGISEVLFAFGIGLTFTYLFTVRVGGCLLGPLDGVQLSFLQRLLLLMIAETGLFIGGAYAALFWMLTMRLFITWEEMEARLEEHDVPLISKGVMMIFYFVRGTLRSKAKPIDRRC